MATFTALPKPSAASRLFASIPVLLHDTRSTKGGRARLKPGKLADLVVLSADYLTVPEDQIKDIKADVTIVGGKVVFQR